MISVEIERDNFGWKDISLVFDNYENEKHLGVVKKLLQMIKPPDNKLSICQLLNSWLLDWKKNNDLNEKRSCRVDKQ